MPVKFKPSVTDGHWLNATLQLSYRIDVQLDTAARIQFGLVLSM